MPKDNSTDSYTMEEEVPSPNFKCLDFYQKRKKGKYRLCAAPDTSFAVADTHCHLEMFENPEWTIIRAAFHNVSFLACVLDSTDDGIEGLNKVEDAYAKAEALLPQVLERVSCEGKQAQERVTIKAAEEEPEFCLDKDAICENAQLPKLRYIIGTHPHHAKHFDGAQEKNLYDMLKHKRACCVGEIGLDYHYDLSPRDAQREVFKTQLQIAKELKLPVSLHLREAHSDALEILDEIGFDEYGTLLHCFNLGPEDLKPWLEAGCYIALGGPLTFKNSESTREAAKLIPKDKLLTETDAPFMTPEPLRGDACFPDHVIFNAQMLYDVCGNGESRQTFYSQIYQNALELLDR